LDLPGPKGLRALTIVPEAQTTCPPPAKGDGGVFFDDRNMGISWRNLMGISWEYIYIFIFIYLFMHFFIYIWGVLKSCGIPGRHWLVVKLY
jgi:hypothetical protein